MYVITDVAILPLSSQKDASRSIAAAVESHSASDNSTTDTDTDVSDTEANDKSAQDHPEPETPSDRVPSKPQAPSSTSIARDVIANRGQYGRFAAQWFSKQGWSGAGSASGLTRPMQHDSIDTTSSTADGNAAVAANQPQGSADVAAQEQAHEKDAIQMEGGISVIEAIPKILRRTRMILTSGSYFFSYEFDLTRRLATTNGKAIAPAKETLDPMVCIESEPWLLAVSTDSD